MYQLGRLLLFPAAHLLLAAFFFLVSFSSQIKADPPAPEDVLVNAEQAIGTPTLVRSIPFDTSFGSELIRFGDLNHDGVCDLLVVRHKKQRIKLITAITLDGEILWQRGAGNDHTGIIFSDLAVQIFDINQDGKNEIIVVVGSSLGILAGDTGETLQKVKVPKDARDSIAFAKLRRGKNPYAIILKNRYSKFWVYSPRLRLKYERSLRTGHYPVEFDLNGDGRDEFLMGYVLFRPNGQPLWKAGRIKRHNDAADIEDVDGDGIPEIAIASSGDSYLLDKDGKTLWKQPHRHSQHAVIAGLRPDSGGNKQVVFVERPKGNLYTYDKDGALLWNIPKLGKTTMISAVSGWSDAEQQDFLIAFRMANHNPALLNGDGEVVAEFPFPWAGSPESGMSKHFVHHFDILGDHREEIIIHNQNGVWVYENSDPPTHTMVIQEAAPNRRMYNATFYIGSQ